MTAIEKKVREYVKQAYLDYKIAHSQYAYSVYSNKMEMLKDLFPKTTNEENLERKWDSQFKKEGI